MSCEEIISIIIISDLVNGIKTDFVLTRGSVTSVWKWMMRVENVVYIEVGSVGKFYSSTSPSQGIDITSTESRSRIVSINILSPSPLTDLECNSMTE